MSNHYPHQNRYVPSKLLPTHCYREHNEFGIPFKRYPLNFDEHEESGYYIDFNQTHLVYAVPCTDITFSKKYNRDDLKNETIDTTAETRETVGTTAARYHNNTHSRHYPHCAHSSHVQGFDVLTIAKLMDYEMQLHDVTPERLKTLFENFACPQRDTVVFEHVWMEQHKFLSMYFKVHKKPLLDYCLFRFPEPPVCPGPVPPTPGEGPNVQSVVPMTRYIDPETCVTYVDLLVTFDRDVTPLVSDLKEIFAAFDGNEPPDDETILNVQQVDTNQMVVTSTYNDMFVTMILRTFLQNVQDLEGNPGAGEVQNEVNLEDYSKALSITYQDHVFDDLNNMTIVYIAFSREVDYWEGETHITQEEVPVQFAVNNMQYINQRNAITFQVDAETGSFLVPSSINFVEHDGHQCVEFVYSENVQPYSQYGDVFYNADANTFKYVDPDTQDVFINTYQENFVLAWGQLERVISNFGLMVEESTVNGLWVVYPCNEEDILTVDLSGITRAPYDDLSNTVNPTAYNLGRYIQQSELIPQAGREVFLTFSPTVNVSDRYTYVLNTRAISDDTGHYSAYWTRAIPDPEPVPEHGPILLSTWTTYDPQETLPAKIEAVFDQDVEIVDTSGIRVVYANSSGENLLDLVDQLSLTDLNTFIQDVIDYANDDTSVPSAERLIDAYYGTEPDQQMYYQPKRPESGVVWKNKNYFESILPYINNTETDMLAMANAFYFSIDMPGDAYAGWGLFELADYDNDTVAAINKLMEDHATRNSLTVAQLLDGDHNVEAQGLRWLAEYLIPHIAYWDDTDATDAAFQAHINALYNEPLGGQTYPDDAILAIRSVIDGLVDYRNSTTTPTITVTDYLTNTVYESELRSSVVRSGRSLVFVYMLTSACTEQFMIDQLSCIYDTSSQRTPVGFGINYYPLDTNWILPTDITYSTSNTNLIMEFDNPNIRDRSIYVYIPQGAVRNPVSSYINREGTWYTWCETPEVLFYNPYGSYAGSTNSVTIEVNANVPLGFIGNLSDITLTDGINTAVATNVTIPYSNSIQIEFDNSVNPSWAANQNVTLNIAQGVFENLNDTSYTNDAYSAQFYCSSDVPPTPPVTTHTVTFLVDGNVYQTDTVNDGDTVSVPVQPTKQDYTFDGWLLNGSAYNFTDLVYSDLTLEASWTYTPAPPVGTSPDVVGTMLTHDSTRAYPYQIEYTFDQNVLLGSSTGSITDGNNTTVPDNVVVSGDTLLYQFYEPYPDWFASSIGNLDIYLPAGAVTDSTGYYNNLAYSDTGLGFSEVTPVTNITVTFDSDGGSAVASQTIQSGTIPTRPTNPTKSNYTFNYWKLNGNQYNFDVALSSNTTLVADWTYNPPAPTPVNPGTSVYGSYHVIHTYPGTYSQTNTLQMTMNVETSQSGSTAYYKATGSVKAVPGPGATGTTYSNGGVKVTITIAGRSITSAETGNLSSSQDPKSYDTGWLEVPNGVGTGTESMGIAVKDATTGGSGGYCNYSDTASVNKPYTQ